MASTRFNLSLRAIALSTLCLAAAVDAGSVHRRKCGAPPSVVTPTITSSSTSTAESTIEPTITSTTESTTTESAPESTTEAPVSTTTTSEAPGCVTHYPERCLMYLPESCRSLNGDVPANQRSDMENFCQRDLYQAGSLMPEAEPCFNLLNSPEDSAEHPNAIYSCLATSLLCTSTMAPCAATPTPTPDYILYSGFETGQSGFDKEWENDPRAAPDSSDNIQVSVTRQQSHSGLGSLKFAYFAHNYVGVAYRKRELVLEPGAEYEISWWWFSSNNVARTSMVMRLEHTEAGDLVFDSRAYTFSPPGQTYEQWVQQTFRVTAQGSMGTLILQFWASEGAGGNMVYVDDIVMTKVSSAAV